MTWMQLEEKERSLTLETETDTKKIVRIYLIKGHLFHSPSGDPSVAPVYPKCDFFVVVKLFTNNCGETLNPRSSPPECDPTSAPSVAGDRL